MAEACFSGGGDIANTVCPNGQSEQIGAGAAIDCPGSVYGV